MHSSLTFVNAVQRWQETLQGNKGGGGGGVLYLLNAHFPFVMTQMYIAISML